MVPAVALVVMKLVEVLYAEGSLEQSLTELMHFVDKACLQKSNLYH
jgi:hypothetical protein